MKVFYSWQSDTPREIGKDFIREALDAAVSSLELDEAERPEVDQDTAGVLGSPVIAEAIFRKIQGARVVVADVTLTGQTPDGKRLINSNVAIELGYAIGIHGDEVLLKVMNTHYGPPRDLPFDLTHRRWPLRFALPPNATPPDKERVFQSLVSELRQILDIYVQASRPPPEPFSPTPSTTNPAMYWQAGEILVQVGNPQLGDTVVAMGYRPDEPLIYMRVWPHERIQALTGETLNDQSKSVIEPLCGTRSGWSNARNRHGRIAYSWNTANTLSATTQVFKTGEIWGINSYYLQPRPGLPRFLPTTALETGLRNSLTKYLQSAVTHFGYLTKIHCEFGLVNVRGFRLALPDDQFSEGIFEDVKVTTILDMQVPDSVDAALLEMYRRVYEAAGATRR
jgi:hypothetical protein